MLVAAGGDAANQRLHTGLGELPNAQVRFADTGLCTDNGGMIAYGGWLRWNAGERRAYDVRARWPLDGLHPPTREPQDG